jgi:hypothetical protein
VADLEFTLNERGEAVDRRGRIYAALPGEVIECDELVRQRSGKHFPNCKCAGTRTVIVRRPTTDPAYAADDGLTAAFVALASREARGDAYMGDSTGRLMAGPSHEYGAGSSGSRRHNKPQPKKSTGEPHPKTANDGREEPWLEVKAAAGRARAARQTIETRRGRPTRFDAPLTHTLTVAIAPAMMARLMSLDGLDLEEVAHEIEIDPRWASIVAEHATLIGESI